MSRTIDAIIEEAQKRLETSGRLDVSAYAEAYPQYAEELRRLLPVLLQVDEERRWLEMEERANQFAMKLFAMPVADEVQDEGTVAALFRWEQSETGMTPEVHARKCGLSTAVVSELLRDPTPVSELTPGRIKQLATKLSAPFDALAREIGRLKALFALPSTSAGMVFTRAREASTASEQEELIKRVMGPRRPGGSPPDREK